MAIDKSLLKTLAVPSVMLGITVVAGAVATIPISTADADDDIVVTVDSACTMGQTVESAHTTQLNPGETNSTIGQSRIAAYCNDTEGYAIYAIGYTNGEYGNTNLVSTNGNAIATGVNGSGSYWNMQLAPATSGDYIPNIVSPFTTNTAIPNDYTKVAYRDSITPGQTVDPTTSGSYFTTTYQAHVSTTQPAGVYNGQVQYVMVHPSGAVAPEKPNIGSLTYMQDLARLSEQEKASIISNTRVEVAYTLKDERDGQEYTVAKLKDGKIWMTKNLNLAGGTEITSELSNVPDGYTLPTANGFQEGNKLPAPSTSGFDNDTKAFVYNSTKTSGTNCTRPGCYSYYSWTAATAGSGISIDTNNTDAPYSICPKGWRLPSIRTTSAANWQTKSDFYQLAVAYGMAEGSNGQSTSNFYNQAGPGTTPNFLLAGSYGGSRFYDGGYRGDYWSSTSEISSTRAWYFRFESSTVSSATSVNRNYGFAVRCIAEQE